MIRYLEEKDFQEVYDLGNQISPNFSITNNLEEVLQDKYTKVLVYEKDGHIHAFLMYVILADNVDIIDIIVESTYRRNHIACCLIDYMISELPLNVKLITLEVRVSNEPAISLYEKFGFEKRNIRKNYYADEDAYLMVREL